MNVSIDFETRSTIDLRQVGVYRYAEEPTTDVWCMAYKVEDEPVDIWIEGEDPPEWVFYRGDPRVFAWNAGFERTIWNRILAKRYGWPHLPLEVWCDTAAAAAYLSLPRALEKAALVLLPEEYQKDMAGSRLCGQMSRPRKIREDGTPIWWDDPKKLRGLYAYCKQDVVAEHAIKGKVWPAFTDAEMRVWRMDQRMNERGVLVDVRAARGAQAIARETESIISQQMSLLTGGEVDAVTNTGDLLKWVRSKGVPTNTVKREWVEEALRSGNIKRCVRDVLQLRYDGGKSSVAKLNKFIGVASLTDDRARGTLFYYGADTGRWAGRLIQPQNLPRGEIPLDMDDDLLWSLIGNGDRETLEILYGPPMTVISSALRGLLVAAPGHDLIAVDYSAIEARVLAWLAGEERLLQIFRTHGKVYEDMASQIFGIPLEEVTKEQRAHGKVGVLGCGYQMGWETLQGHAEGYGMRLTEEEARRIVEGYRGANPAIRRFWSDLNAAAIMAVAQPGTEHFAGRVSLRVEGWFLKMRLPSGRELFYASPRLVQRPLPWNPERTQTCAQIWHVNSTTKQWSPRVLYGGLLAENATQAVARDVMVDGMFATQSAGPYNLLLTVHDEIVLEVPTDQGSLQDVERLATTLGPWADGLPISAEGWRGKRYRKD